VNTSAADRDRLPQFRIRDHEPVLDGELDT
jgi:hypothetical protein